MLWEALAVRADGGFFVLEGARFTWCPAARVQPDVVTADELLSLLEPERDGDRASAGTRADPGCTLTPGRAVASQLRDGRLVVFSDRTGRWVHLGADHVRVLATLEGERTVQAVADLTGTPVGAVAAAVADLEEIGCIRTDRADRPAQREAG